MSSTLGLKTQLHSKCCEIVDQRIQNAKAAMDSAREASNDDTKSSAGDKYETGREMLQQELENNAIQLNEARKLREILEKVDYKHSHTNVQSGSLVITNNGNFFISVGLGKLTLDGTDYFAIAPTSPLGEKLIGTKPADKFDLNGRIFEINHIQ